MRPRRPENLHEDPVPDPVVRCWAAVQGAGLSRCHAQLLGHAVAHPAVMAGALAVPKGSKTASVRAAAGKPLGIALAAIRGRYTPERSLSNLKEAIRAILRDVAGPQRGNA